MGRRKKQKPEPRLPEDWVVETETKVNGRTLVPGTEVSIQAKTSEGRWRKIPGRYRFVKRVTTKSTSWLDFVGGKDGHAAFRSFSEEQVRTVHRIAKTRANNG